jgi:hypothetical protein
MPIKFTCPHCLKPLTVKDSLAGKRGACPKCKKMLTVPSAVSSTPATPSEDIEELAARALTEEPQAAPEAEPKTIDFNCPQCDEALQMPVELQGKQAPCPSCRRIIKVPLLIKREPLDWRKKDSLPTGARRDNEPAPEGTWSSTSTTMVSKEALSEVVLPRRPPLTLRQKIVRGSIVASVALLLGLGTWLGLSMWGQHKQETAFDRALKSLNQEGLSKEGKAVLHVGLGEYLFRSSGEGSLNQARDHFQEARSSLASLPPSAQNDLLLTDVARAQIEMGGSKEEAKKQIRLDWTATIKEVRQTLQNLHDSEGRAEALRTILPPLIARGQAAEAKALAVQIANGSPEPLAIAGLEMVRAGEQDTAKQLAQQALQLSAPASSQGAPPPVASSVVALCLVVGVEPKIGDPKKEDRDAFLIGQSEAAGWQDKLDEARRLIHDLPTDEVRCKAWVAVAAAGKAPNAQALDEAYKSAEIRPQLLSPWLLLRMVRLGLKANFAEERVLKMAGFIGDPSLRNVAHLDILRDKLTRSNDQADTAWTDTLPKDSLAHSLGLLAIARHNSRRDKEFGKNVETWEPATVRPFGLVGVALGMQDSEPLH